LAVRQLRRGQTVKFFSRGTYHQGTVEKVAQKYVTVDTGASRWRVPAGHLEKVA
jgi:ribosomal protein S1